MLRSVLAAVLVLPGLLLGAAAGAGAATQPAGGDPVLWRVPVSSGAQIAALDRAGFDVAEPADGAAFVVGDGTVADRLRALGYRPTRFDTVYKDAPRAAEPQAAAGTFYGGYRTVAAQEAHLTQVAAAHPDLATTYDVGDSWLKTKGRGGHDVDAICLTKKKAGDCALNPNSTKPRFTLMAQIHAREISTGELAWRWIDYLVNGYGKDADATSILDSTEVWVVPIANPDGVDIVASGGNRPLLQRKNADTTYGSCGTPNNGIDLNRNSSFHWGGDSNAACDETFQGPRATSEPETVALEHMFDQLYPVQRGQGDNDPAPVTARGTMITLHSYGNDIIVPWGWTENPSPNDAALRAWGNKMAAYNGYVVDTNGGTVGYKTTGTTDDFTYGHLGVASVTFEVGGSSGSCGGFFPKYSCVDSLFWPKNKGAFVVAAKAAAAPYRP
ncbi:peptidase M14 [Solihabitans fulvus]|uniref:Peptidase M14 n=1 Tax=Solihabitans fulvus TaxID=1892852 RepID=A0A5B2X6P5_9PSEU|nr:peptidase M14 [Solihabitans fulvus]